MFRIRIATAVCLAAAASGFAADQNVDLKLREVTLFSSGVGFFEQEADVTGAAMADLRFRAEQINDILKSMVVQDFDGGSVGVVTYTAKDPLERILDSFGVDLQENGTLAELLGSLRGERIRIQGPVAMEGVILSVEKFQRTRPDGETLTTIDMLNILTDAGMQQLVISELTGIKLLNEKTAAELNKALAALATTHDTDKKSVRIQFNGQGQRHVKVSFLRETPIWKTSYRLVLDKEEKPFLKAGPSSRTPRMRTGAMFVCHWYPAGRSPSSWTCTAPSTSIVRSRTWNCMRRCVHRSSGPVLEAAEDSAKRWLRTPLCLRRRSAAIGPWAGD